jgi:putative tricarboxylic transport membrane protein
LFTNHITGKSPINYTDFSVIANLGTEPSAIAVRLDSPLKSSRELFDRLKQDPSAYSISIGSTMGGTSHMALSRAYKAMGGDPRKLKAVAFAGTADAIPQLLGGHIDALISAINNAVPHVKAGKMRALAVTSPQRLTGEFASVPTLRDLGVDVVQMGWTIVMGPKGLTPAQVRYWEDMIAKAAQTPEWKAYLAENYWTYTFQRSGETVSYLASEYEIARRALTDLGMAKTDVAR